VTTSFSADLDMKTVERNLATLGTKFPKAVREKGAPVIGQLVLAEAQALAPIKTGFLANDSAFSRVEGGGAVVGFNAQYAAAVHERHPTQSKFLLRALTGHAERIVRGVLTKIHDSMEREVRP
jgi:hypothetical protein